MVTSLHPLAYEDQIREALREDLGRAGDLTTDAIVPSGSRTRAVLVSRGAGCIAGLEVALATFRLLDPELCCDLEITDGQEVRENSVLATLNGYARALLSAERTALNFLGHLSGVATATRRLVRALEGTGTHVACTRKTTPGLRILEKYAVRVGGGLNHRFGLDDAVLIKDNHLAIAGSVKTAVERVRYSVGHMVKVEVEVESLAQLDEAVSQNVDAVLLDNMTPEQVAEAVSRVKGKVITEVSGRVTPETIVSYADAGVDLISLGWITHSAPVLDVALDIQI